MIYDHTSGYRLFLIAGVLGRTLGGMLIISMPAYAKWNQQEKGVA